MLILVRYSKLRRIMLMAFNSDTLRSSNLRRITIYILIFYTDLRSQHSKRVESKYTTVNLQTHNKTTNRVDATNRCLTKIDLFCIENAKCN